MTIADIGIRQSSVYGFVTFQGLHVKQSTRVTSSVNNTERKIQNFRLFMLMVTDNPEFI